MESNKVIIQQLQKMINKILFKKRKNFQFQDIVLFPAEIHLMIVADETYPSNATQIAQRLGVTKGAVSQTLSRLERKGILHKNKDPYSKNELELTFTKLGQKALIYYKKQFTELFRQKEHYLINLTEKEKIIIKQFMSQMEILIEQIH